MSCGMEMAYNKIVSYAIARNLNRGHIQSVGTFITTWICFLGTSDEKTSDNVSIESNGGSLANSASLSFSRLWMSALETETFQQTRVSVGTSSSSGFFITLMASLRDHTNLFASIMTGKMRSDGSPRTQQFSCSIVGANGVTERA